MVKKIVVSFLLAFQNIRSNFFHTILSVLGIVIGVAALVAILSLIDGMEEFARNQITKTTSLKAIVVQSDPVKRINDIRIRKDTFPVIDYEHYLQIKKKFEGRANAYIRVSQSQEINVKGKDAPVGIMVYATGSLLGTNMEINKGVIFSDKQILDKENVAVVNYALASELSDGDNDTLVGTYLGLNEFELKIIGVLKDDSNKTPQVYLPLSLLNASELKKNPPLLALEANQIEDVAMLKDEVIEYLKNNYPSYKNDFTISTNEVRVKQAAQGFLLFRVIMGLIVGISVLVGGIGVMNVLLISVTERTAEIGIRKAVGANKSDIILQFLCESVTVSAFGSLIGLIFGVLGTMIIIPIIKILTKAPFQAAYTLNTFLIISIVALAIGIIFGTYPALRASKLDPVEAIRRD